MMGKVVRHLGRSFEKNAPEIKAFLTGQMPSFVTQRRGSTLLGEVPVLVFHDVEPEILDTQLLYLRSNGYRTLDAEALQVAAQGSMSKRRQVALTFDDATWTFWAYAYPLLKKHDFRAILFVIPGIVPEDSTVYPGLEDVWDGRYSRGDLDRRGKIQPLCTWRELAIMHGSGIVDVQSHSLTHARVPVSPRLVDFLHPGFDTYISNLNVPISALDDPEHPERRLRLGAPVFRSVPRMVCRPWFKENPQLVRAMTGYVEEHGGSAFFQRPSWRRELTALVRRWPAERLGSFETSEEMVAFARREFAESKKIVEERLVAKEVRHFCYPWYGGSALADRLAAEAGYRAVHYGPAINRRKAQTRAEPCQIRRISEEYLLRLPGDNRLSIWSIWMNRVRRLISRQGSAS
jgi:peptidoglycan/xylan/chitin deacetylase (PgdA/CDA1 family)